MAKTISYYEGIDRLYGKEMANAVGELLASWDGNIAGARYGALCAAVREGSIQ